MAAQFGFTTASAALPAAAFASSTAPPIAPPILAPRSPPIAPPIFAPLAAPDLVRTSRTAGHGSLCYIGRRKLRPSGIVTVIRFGVKGRPIVVVPKDPFVLRSVVPPVIVLIFVAPLVRVIRNSTHRSAYCPVRCRECRGARSRSSRRYSRIASRFSTRCCTAAGSRTIDPAQSPEFLHGPRRVVHRPWHTGPPRFTLAHSLRQSGLVARLHWLRLPVSGLLHRPEPKHSKLRASAPRTLAMKGQFSSSSASPKKNFARASGSNSGTTEACRKFALLTSKKPFRHIACQQQFEEPVAPAAASKSHLTAEQRFVSVMCCRRWLGSTLAALTCARPVFSVRCLQTASTEYQLCKNRFNRKPIRRPRMTKQDAPGSAEAEVGHESPETDPLWYKDAIIYEFHVRAFCDSGDDGIGDFRGLTQKLDYLQDLGVTAIWLLPFYPSPLRDDGYDIADYTDVHPAYGTLERLQGVSARGARARLAGHYRTGAQSHFRSAPVVSTRPPGAAGKSRARFLCLERHAGQSTRTRGSSSRISRLRTGRGIPSPTPITGIAFTRISPI